MTVSIITPLLARTEIRLRWLHETIASVGGQTVKDWEMIIVDDHSPIDPAGIVQYWQDKNYPVKLLRAEGKGVSAARNQAADAAQYPLLLPLDADDLLSTDALEKFLQAWHDNGEEGVIYSDIMRFGKDWQRAYLAPEYSFRRLMEKTFMIVGCLHSKKDWERVGGWRLDMTTGLEIWEYWIALGEIGVCGRRMPHPVYWYRQHKQGRLAMLKAEGHKRYRESELRLRDLHQEIYNGRFPMGCCGDSVSQTGKAPANTSILHRQVADENLTQLLYVGKKKGGFFVAGGVTKILYHVPGRGALVEEKETGRAGVLKEDVPWFRRIQAGRDFKIQSKPAPPPPPTVPAKAPPPPAAPSKPERTAAWQQPKPPVAPEPETLPAETAEKGLEINATPGAKKLAAELGIDLNEVKGTGKEGKILVGDVKSHS